MPDLLSACLSRIPDGNALESLAVDFNARADVLSSDARSEARAWSQVYRVLAVSAESALLRRRTGVSL